MPLAGNLAQRGLVWQPLTASFAAAILGAMLKKTDLTAIDLAHQCRFGPMTAWEQDLGDALETIFAKGIVDLGAIVRELNAMRVFAIDGSPWTEASFKGAMAQMGA